MRNGHPGQDKEAGVVREQVDVLQPFLGGPADESVALAQMARRRTPRHAGDRASIGEDHVLQVLANRLGVAEQPFQGDFFAFNNLAVETCGSFLSEMRGGCFFFGPRLCFLYLSRLMLFASCTNTSAKALTVNA